MIEAMLSSSLISHSLFSAKLVKTPAARRVSSASRTVTSMNSDPAWCLSSGRGSLGDDFAEVDDGYFVGQLVGFFEVLGREENRCAFAD